MGVTLAAATIWNLITMGQTSIEISSNGVNHEFTWTITGEPFAHCIAPGDTMKFNWSGTFHNVQSVDKDGYDNCSGFSNTQGVRVLIYSMAPQQEHTTLSVGLELIVHLGNRKQS